MQEAHARAETACGNAYNAVERLYRIAETMGWEGLSADAQMILVELARLQNDLLSTPVKKTLRRRATGDAGYQS